MINPSKTYEVSGKIISIDSMTSLTVYKVKTKHGIFDHNVFGMPDPKLVVGSTLNVTIGYSITLNGYSIRYVNQTSKAA